MGTKKNDGRPEREANVREVECVCGNFMDVVLSATDGGLVVYNARCEACERLVQLRVTAAAGKGSKS